MKIYFGAAITYSRKLLPQYQKIVATVKKLDHLVLSEYVIDPKIKPGAGLSAEKLFEREAKTVEKADAMIAEVTTPSWGTPFLMTHALKHDIPVLALFYTDSPQKVPLMIKGHPDLYVENYDEDNIELILEKYLKHFANGRSRRGKLIVIDGGDGSGKQTQADLLVNCLKNKGLPVKYFDFPRYYTSFHGKIVGRFLAGEFGKLNEVNPYLASLAYALDRASLKEEMDEWLGKGGLIISNRYVTSSMAHQAARLPLQKRRQEFIAWLDELEYKVHKIPREDLVIYLYVPWKIGLQLSKKKKERGYVKGLDIAEISIEHRQKVEKMYLWLAKHKKNWLQINCCRDSKMRSREDIHQEILKVLKEKRII